MNPAEPAAGPRLPAALVAALAATLDDEAPPEGIPAALWSPDEDAGNGGTEEGCDRYRLWEALTVLAQETKLQGRAFAALREAIEGALTAEADLDALCAAAEAATEAAQENARVAQEAIRALDRERERAVERRALARPVEVAIELRERLLRGRDEAAAGTRRQAREATWRRWLVPREGAREALAAYEQGYTLALAEVDAFLDELGIEEIRAAGRPFDSAAMRAVAVRATDAVAAGTVTEVMRRGYRWQGAIVRPVEVEVARADLPGETDAPQRAGTNGECDR